MLGGLVTLAQDLYVEPATPLAEEVQSLFNVTLGIALFVFVLVEGLLIYMIVKFRRNTKVPRDETHRGHTTAEVVWTVIPAGLLLFLGFLSAGTLVELDEVPRDVDFAVHVEASQFTFRFYYPDATGTAYAGQGASEWCRVREQCSFSVLRVEEGSRVKLTVSGTDVIHAFAVPELAIKVDAVPGKVNTRWFEAPQTSGAESRYFIQCMEYCGVGHHLMGSSKEAVDAARDGGQAVPELVVFAAGSQDRAWGVPAAATPPDGAPPAP